MPLYEAVVIAKAGPARNTSQTLRSLLKDFLEKHPTARVREVESLGDRIMGKALKESKILHHVGRYIQISYDGSPNASKEFQRLCYEYPYNLEILRSYSHKISDFQYPLSMYMKAARLIDPYVTAKEDRDYDYAREIFRFKQNYK